MYIHSVADPGYNSIIKKGRMELLTVYEILALEAFVTLPT